jgi:hypothetical protein
MTSQNQQIDIESELISEIKEDTIPTQNVSNTINDKSNTQPESDSSFSTGIAIGIGIGTAIGILSIFIIRQKPPK